MHIIILLGLTIIGSIIHMAISHSDVLQTLLMYFLVVYFGIGGLFFATGHLFKGKQIAKDIGWDAGSPFQEEVGFANLAFGIMGILCIWFRGDFWLVYAIGIAVFLLGAAFTHLKDLRKNDNQSKYNTGFTLLFIHDIVIPLFVLTLAIIQS